MRELLRAAALVAGLSPVAAVAQVQTYYHAGAWDAFSGRDDKGGGRDDKGGGRDDKGGAVCGIGTTLPDMRRLTVQFNIGGTDTLFSASKPDWSIPDNTPVTVVMQIGLDTPWTEHATGRGHAIDWSLDPAAMPAFDQQFRGASSMTLTFPNGNEPPWSLSLDGSTEISETIARCVRDLTRQVEAAGPPPSGEPAPPAATQPFSPR